MTRVGGKDFGEVRCLTLLALFNSYMHRTLERDKALPRSIMVEVVWNGFLLGHAKGEIVPCRFCGGFHGDGHIFGMSSPLLWFKYVKILSFTI